MPEARRLRARAQQCLEIAAVLSDRDGRERMQAQAAGYLAEAERLDGGQSQDLMLGRERGGD